MATPGRALASRGGFPASSRGNKPSHTTITCNRCRRPLATTLFVCSCDCVFCEECTYDHFNNSSRCPSCTKELGANDFCELVVADPSQASSESMKNTFQTLFTKFNANANTLTHHEMCSRILKTLDEHKRIVRFLLKQVLQDASVHGTKSGNLGRAYEDLKKDHTQLKQQWSSQRIQMEQTISDLQNRMSALQNKLEQKDTQITQFRQLYAQQGMARAPTSSGHSQSSSTRGGSHGGMVVGSGGPPMPDFVRQKRARELAKEEAAAQQQRHGRPGLLQGHAGRRSSHATANLLVATPMQVVPASGGTVYSEGGGGGGPLMGGGGRASAPMPQYVFAGSSRHGGGPMQQKQQQQQARVSHTSGYHHGSRGVSQHGYRSSSNNYGRS